MTGTPDPVIVVEGLRKEFRATRRDAGLRAAVRSLLSPRRETIVAVEDVSFAVEPGEILGYLGPNGAGKSTTIKMLTGVLVPTAGHARVLGLEPYRHRTRNATQIGVVFGQRTQLWWDLPAIESFAILRHMYQVPEGAYRETIEELDEYLGLAIFVLVQPALHLTWTPLAIVYLCLVIVGSVLLEAGIFLAIAAVMFWVIQSESLVWWAGDLVNTFGNYPLSIFPQATRYLFTFVFPIAFLGFFPAAVFLGRAGDVPFTPVLAYGAPAVGLIVFVVGYAAWLVGLRHHQSTDT